MKSRGFTLIELLITVAIVGILAAIALPSYREQVQKSQRTDGKAALLTAAVQMQRYFTERNTFATATLGSPPAVFPTTSEKGYYTMCTTQSRRDDLHADRRPHRSSDGRSLRHVHHKRGRTEGHHRRNQAYGRMLEIAER